MKVSFHCLVVVFLIVNIFLISGLFLSQERTLLLPGKAQINGYCIEQSFDKWWPPINAACHILCENGNVMAKNRSYNDHVCCR